jgi:hypothetical protein
MRYLQATSGFFLCGLVLLAALAQAGVPAPAVAPLRVGVFADRGADEYCVIEALEALRIDPAITAFPVTAADIQRGGWTTPTSSCFRVEAAAAST